MNNATIFRGLHGGPVVVLKTEILAQSQKIATKYGLYENALLHTEVAALAWDDAENCWRVTTNRGDAFTTTYLGVGTGPFVVPKLPGITVRARPGRLSGLSVLHSKLFFYGAFVWARSVFNSQKRRFPAWVGA